MSKEAALISNEHIKSWVEKTQPALDNPEVYTKDINSREMTGEADVRICLTMPVEYSAAIANLGVSILYSDLNNMENVEAERFYWPEQKMAKRMSKEFIPFFSKETCTPLCNFDIVGFSCYYPLQFLNVYPVLERAKITQESCDRGDNEPIVIMGGVAAFNPAPIHAPIDAFFIGDGEDMFPAAVEIYKEEKKSGKFSRRRVLERWACEVNGVYVPAFYIETYDDKGNVLGHSLSPEAPEGCPTKVVRAVADLTKHAPLTDMFVSNSEGQEMSAGSLEISRGCSSRCFFCVEKGTMISTPTGLVSIEDIRAGDEVLSLNTSTGETEVVKALYGSVHTGRKEVIMCKTSSQGAHVSLTKSHEFYTSSMEKVAADLVGHTPLARSESTDEFLIDTEYFLISVIGADFCLTGKYPTARWKIGRPILDWMVRNFKPNTNSVVNKKGKPYQRHLRYTRGYINALAYSAFGNSRSNEKVVSGNFKIDSVNKAASIVFGLVLTDFSIRRSSKQAIFSSTSEKLNNYYSSALTFLGIKHYLSDKKDRFCCTVSDGISLLRLKTIITKLSRQTGIFFELDSSIWERKESRELRIMQKKSRGIRDVYDMTIDKNHNYFANGFLVSNCEGSYRSAPYRERPLDMVKKGFEKLIYNTGVSTVTPYCIGGESLIKTNNGLMRIDSIKEGMQVFTREGLREVKQVHKVMHDRVFIIENNLGNVLRSSGEHKVLTKKGWLEVKDLVLGDSVLYLNQDEDPLNYVRIGSNTIDERWAEVLGHLIGDGHLVPTGRRVEFNCSYKEEKRVAHLKSLLDELLFSLEERDGLNSRQNKGSVCSRYPKEGFYNGCSTLKVHSVDFLDMLESFGVSRCCTAHNKEVPFVIFESPKKVKAAFLRMLFDCDGTVCKVGKGWRVGYKTASIELARGIQQLLLTFNIYSDINIEYKENSAAVGLNICGKGKETFISEIGFFSDEKIVKSENVRGLDSRLDLCHNGCWTTIQKLGIEEGDEYLYDLGIDETHEYLAQGFVVHNSFNLSDHTRVNDIIYWLLMDESRKVSMSSQRIDYFSKDFAKTAFSSGNRSITLAIEAGSQRMRDKVNKQLPEEAIMKAFRVAFEVGFGAIKVYMIANLPEETQEDIDSLIDLARKIEALRLEVEEEKKVLVKTRIRFSFTPFNSKAHTPLQWAKGLDVDPDTRLPIFRKNLGTVIEGLREFNMRFRVGTDSDLSSMNQIISLGDRRICNAMKEISYSSEFTYRGGMSLGKGKITKFRDVIEKHAMGFEYYFKEKTEDQVFSWDFIDMGITKKYLKKMYFQHFKNGDGSSKCFDSCKACGACDDTQKKFIKGWKEEKKGDLQNIGKAMDYYTKNAVVKKLVVKFSVDEYFRYVHSTKIKMRLRRACVRAGVAVRSDFTLVSDKIVYMDWIHGINYGEIKLVKDLDISTEELTKALNAEFDAGTIFSVKEYNVDYFDFRKSTGDVLYLAFTKSFSNDMKYLQAAAEQIMEKDEYIVSLKVKGDVRDTWKVVDTDIRPFIKSLWAGNEERPHIFGLLSDKICMYDVLPGILLKKKRDILTLPIERKQILLKQDAGVPDMFAPTCEECGTQIEMDLFGDYIAQSKCARHLF